MSDLSRSLKDQHRYLVLARGKDQLCGGLLMHVYESSAEKQKLGAGQFRYVEAEGNFVLKPGLDSMSIGGNNIDRVGAGKSLDVQVRYFA